MVRHQGYNYVMWILVVNSRNTFINNQRLKCIRFKMCHTIIFNTFVHIDLRSWRILMNSMLHVCLIVKFLTIVVVIFHRIQ